MKREIHGSTNGLPHFIAQAWVLATATSEVYFRYVDNTFCVFKREVEENNILLFLILFTQLLNSH